MNANRPSTPIGSLSGAGDPFAASASKNQAGASSIEDEFDGLEDAKEGSADDDFANISRSGFDDFNPVFDSSPHNRQILCRP